MPRNTDIARKARKKAIQSKEDQRKSPLFSYRGWRIVKFDDLNMKLVHKDDTPKTNRYYSTLGGALFGLRKEIGRKCSNLEDAIASWDELGAKIEAHYLTA